MAHDGTALTTRGTIPLNNPFIPSSFNILRNIRCARCSGVLKEINELSNKLDHIKYVQGLKILAQFAFAFL